jgi:cell division protein FtsB
MTEIDAEVSQLGYWRNRTERRSWMARLTALVALFGLLMLNTYLLFVSTDTIVMNVDQARLEASDQVDRLELRMEALEEQIADLKAEGRTPQVVAGR